MKEESRGPSHLWCGDPAINAFLEYAHEEDGWTTVDMSPSTADLLAKTVRQLGPDEYLRIFHELKARRVFVWRHDEEPDAPGDGYRRFQRARNWLCSAGLRSDWAGDQAFRVSCWHPYPPPNAPKFSHLMMARRQIGTQSP